MKQIVWKTKRDYLKEGNLTEDSIAYLKTLNDDDIPEPGMIEFEETEEERAERERLEDEEERQDFEQIYKCCKRWANDGINYDYFSVDLYRAWRKAVTDLADIACNWEDDTDPNNYGDDIHREMLGYIEDQLRNDDVPPLLEKPLEKDEHLCFPGCKNGFAIMTTNGRTIYIYGEGRFFDV